MAKAEFKLLQSKEIGTKMKIGPINVFIHFTIKYLT